MCLSQSTRRCSCPAISKINPLRSGQVDEPHRRDRRRRRSGGGGDQRLVGVDAVVPHKRVPHGFLGASLEGGDARMPILSRRFARSVPLLLPRPRVCLRIRRSRPHRIRLFVDAGVPAVRRCGGTARCRVSECAPAPMTPRASPPRGESGLYRPLLPFCSKIITLCRLIWIILSKK